jgi:hypothetical protein
MKTLSEQLFEDFCAAHGLAARPIDRACEKTPDYEVERFGRPVVFEVKQLDPNRQDAVAREVLHNGEAFADYQRNRVRPILKHVSPQLKSASQKGKPGILLVFNNTPFSAGTDPDSVLQAMYGRKRVVVSFDEQGLPSTSDPFLAGDEGVTPTENTSMSALCVLRRHGDGSLSLDVFHNRWATIRLDPGWFAGLPARQLVVADDGHFCGHGAWPELRRWGLIEQPLQ